MICRHLPSSQLWLWRIQDNWFHFLSLCTPVLRVEAGCLRTTCGTLNEVWRPIVSLYLATLLCKVLDRLGEQQSVLTPIRRCWLTWLVECVCFWLISLCLYRPLRSDCLFRNCRTPFRKPDIVICCDDGGRRNTGMMLLLIFRLTSDPGRIALFCRRPYCLCCICMLSGELH